MRPVEPSAEWFALPAAVRAEIEARAGHVRGTSPAGEGLSTSVRLILHTMSGNVFVKGTGPDATSHQRARLALGADLAPSLTGISPPLLWRAEADDWSVTAWPALPGRPWAILGPGSNDIPTITGVLTMLSRVPAPDILTSTARDYWQHYTDDPAALDGDAIVHRDPNPTNFIFDEVSGRAWMVDWGWAQRGPDWMTSANLILSLMEAGWEPADADNALQAVPAWANAPRHAVDEYAAASVREWEHIMGRGPVHPMWQRRADLARSWDNYRHTIARF
jgi:hypothetical protein